MAELWKELHLHALNYQTAQEKSETTYLIQFASRIPKYTPGCACREHWLNWVKQNPPQFRNKEEYFAWTVRAHNNINKLLGEKEFTVEEAKEYYSNLNLPK